MLKFVISNKEEGQTLEKYVRQVLKDAPLSFIYKLFRKKDVKVNNRWQDLKYVVSANEEISIYITEEQLNEFSNTKVINGNDAIREWIIYEDNNVLLVNKPRGVLAQKENKSSKKALDEMVIEYLVYKKEYNPQTDLAFTPGPAHRIDRNTSGIVLFGKNKKTLEQLFELFKNHDLIGKHYLALVKGHVESDGYVNAPLKKILDNKVVVASKKDGGKPAKTIYKVKEYFGDYTLLDLTLVTGRTHQIRVHMSYINHPLVGDSKYGDFETNHYFENFYHFKNQFLHAYSISFGQLEPPLNNLSSSCFIAPMSQEFENLLSKIK